MFNIFLFPDLAVEWELVTLPTETNMKRQGIKNSKLMNYTNPAIKELFQGGFYV